MKVLTHCLRRVAVLTVLLPMLLAGVLLPAPSHAASPAQTRMPVPGQCIDGVLPHGARSRICIPASGWNGDLVVWGHGYVDVTQPIGFYHLTLPGGIALSDLVQQLGFAFATTSYRQNGLAIVTGVDDVVELVQAFRRLPAARKAGAPRHTYMVGASEGGAITSLLIERHPELFSGGLAACGPIGDFRAEIDYLGDFRVLFDYFFPGVLPGSTIAISPDVIANWDSTYLPRIRAAVAAAPDKATQLISAAHAASDPADPSTVSTTIEHVLWYNVFGTNDIVQKLGGNPYDNRTRWYWGSADDLRLNLSVPRFDANPAALAATAAYQTSGHVVEPLVTLHTTGDEIIPFWHEILYGIKVGAAGSSSRVTQIPAFSYGHCQFTIEQMLFAFGVLVFQVSGSQPAAMSPHIDAKQAREQAQRDFARASASAGGTVPHSR